MSGQQWLASTTALGSTEAPPRAVEEPYDAQGFLLVRQYDLPSYGREELEVDYAFVNFMI
ncbi:hypothetical protein N7510_007426 [Penicillium lagena]|uniref:uncharacterized protein n=1 Tax=Penicillium lagena TaxID=94218 RepID=UPI0025403EF0|nr:uncharacterized protein N7510_007426 [Penicillium lagena]KAJ5610707.1 hypothetical protein N7510_007426 [Penicillium lagena]